MTQHDRAMLIHGLLMRLMRDSPIIASLMQTLGDEEVIRSFDFVLSEIEALGYHIVPHAGGQAATH